MSVEVEITDNGVSVDFTTGISSIAGASDVDFSTIQTGYFMRWNGLKLVGEPVTPGGMQNLVEDVTPQLGGSLDCQNFDIGSIGAATFNGEVANTGAAQTIDWSASLKHRTLIAGATTLTFTDPAGPCNMMLKLVNAGAGAITWPAEVLWPNNGTEPTWTVTGTDVASFYFDGTNYYGMAGVDFA